MGLPVGAGRSRSTRPGTSRAGDPGVGWAVWRDAGQLPDDLVFKVDYLGGDMPTFALNFSRPGGEVVAQYYNFLRLGWDGYRHVQQTSAGSRRDSPRRSPPWARFELLSEGRELPASAFTLKDSVTRYSVFDISERIRSRGWPVPAYTFPANLEHVAVLRIVVKNGFSMDLAGCLLTDIREQIKTLESVPPVPDPAGGGWETARVLPPLRPGAPGPP